MSEQDGMEVDKDPVKRAEQAMANERDLYVRKVKVSLDAFEQQLTDRFRSPGTYEPLDFARPSLEADYPFEGDTIGKARINRLEDELAQSEQHIDKLEKDSETLGRMLENRDRENSELQKRLAPLTLVVNSLGCAEAQIQQHVCDLLSNITALELDNDQLRQKATNDSKFQDHSACEKQTSDLQAELQLEQMNLISSSKTIKDMRDAIGSLRDQLHKHGVREPLDFRLRQLGFLSDSGSDDGSSASSVLDNRFGSHGNDQQTSRVIS